MKNRPVIVLTGGGSGGHITPLLSLARALKKTSPQCQIIYLGLKGDKLEGLQRRYEVFDQVYTISAGKFRRYHGQSFLAHLADIKTIVLNVRDCFRVLSGIIAARRLLRKIKPDVVFSKGGFVAVPVGIAAHLRGTPLITHDSDAIPGLANRIIGRWAGVHATGMPAGRYPYPKPSIYYTGIPLDERIRLVDAGQQKQYKRTLGLPSDSLVLLVGGAGLGSLSINQKLVEISPDLFNRYPHLQVLHVTGSMHEKEIKNNYRQRLSPEALKHLTVIGFTPDFYQYSGAADLVVTRAGATTLAELAVQAKAAILIPAPFLTGGQQLKNAAELEKREAIEIVADQASSQNLYQKITELLDDPNRRLELAKKLHETAQPDAAQKLADLTLKTAQGMA